MFSQFFIVITRKIGNQNTLLTISVICVNAAILCWQTYRNLIVFRNINCCLRKSGKNTKALASGYEIGERIGETDAESWCAMFLSVGTRGLATVQQRPSPPDSWTPCTSWTGSETDFFSRLLFGLKNGIKFKNNFYHFQNKT